MESTAPTPSALDRIKDVSFKQGMRGYSVDEVDEFLDQAAVEVDALRDELTQLRQQLRQASERIVQLQNGASAPAPAPAPVAAPVTPLAVLPTPTASSSGAEQVAAMISMAQQFIDQAQNEAEAKARELTTTAQERAREIINEARSRAEDEVQRLNGVKQRLSEDVGALTRQLDSERKRVTAVLSELHRWVEDSMRVATASAAPAPAPAPTPAPATAPAPAPTLLTERPATPPPAPRPTIGDFVSPPHEDNGN